ncbi:L-threonylcarbamoyladenylate synthase [Chloroflexota bacterium]
MFGMSLSLEQQLQKGIEILKQGGLVAFPTDTVYGLGADAFHNEAVERIYSIKERPHSQPFPILVADLSQAEAVAESWTPLASLLAQRFWPGALTLLLPKAKTVPSILSGEKGAIGVRLPHHPIPLALIKGLGNPIVGTSANRSGQRSPLTAQEVHLQLDNRLDLVIDGGRCPGGVESTVVDVTEAVPRIVRKGAISEEVIEAFLRKSASP